MHLALEALPLAVEIPTIPIGIVILLGFFSPFAIALINQPWWPSKYKKIVSIVVALAVAAIALAFYYLISGDPVPSWPILVLLALVVSSTSYTLVLKKPASAIEAATSAYRLSPEQYTDVDD